MKVCNTYEIQNPSTDQISKLIKLRMPSITNIDNITNLINYDLRKIRIHIQYLHQNT